MVWISKGATTATEKVIKDTHTTSNRSSFDNLSALLISKLLVNHLNASTNRTSARGSSKQDFIEEGNSSQSDHSGRCCLKMFTLFSSICKKKNERLSLKRRQMRIVATYLKHDDCIHGFMLQYLKVRSESLL